MLDIKIYIIDYLDQLNGGIPISLSINIYEYVFHSIYWVHPTEKSRLECDSNFLKLFGVTDTQDLPFLNTLIEDIEYLLNREEIFKLLNK